MSLKSELRLILERIEKKKYPDIHHIAEMANQLSETLSFSENVKKAIEK